MDRYVNNMLTQLPTDTDLTAVEVSSDIAAGFVGCTGYIDQIVVEDFTSRKADVLYGKDQHGRPFISMLVLDTHLSARTLMEIVRGAPYSERVQESLAWAAKPRVLTLFQRYQDRDDLFVSAGTATLGSPQDCPAEFNDILRGWGGRYRRLSLEVLGASAEDVEVPVRKPRTVDGYHIDGTVGVIDL